METTFKTAAALPSDRDHKRADRVATVVASTDPEEALVMIARQRAAHARQQRWRRGALGLFVLGVAAGTLAIPHLRQRGLAAGREAAPQRPAVAVAMPSPSAPAADAVDLDLSAASTASAPEDPAARCEVDFKEHQWRRAMESCGAAFEAAPDAALAMRIAHAHWAHGDAAGGGSWGSRALELGTKDADAYVLIGHSARAAGDAAAATAAYRSYLEQAPRGWHAARLRTALRELRASASKPAAR